MKLFYRLLLSAGLFCLYSLTASAYTTVPYCSELENYSCIEPQINIGDFLSNIPGLFNEAPSFNTSSIPPTELDFVSSKGYVYVESYHFKFYIPYYVLDLLISSEDYGSSFNLSDWIDVDVNRNKIHDEVDDIIEIFEDIYNDYSKSNSKYNFDMWSGKLPVALDLIMLEGGGIQGYYSHYDNKKFLVVDPVKMYVYFDETYAELHSIELKKRSDIKALIAHEMFHAIQNAYIDDYDWYYSNDIDAYNIYYDNFFEGTAVLMQRNVGGKTSGINNYLGFLSSSPNLYPQKSVLGNNPRETTDPSVNYGAFVWYNFLERKYGKDFIPTLLEEYAKTSENGFLYRNFNATAKAIEKEGSTIYDAYLEYVTWNYDYDKYSYSSEMRGVHIAKNHSKFPTGNVLISSTDEMPTYFASNYIEFDMGSGNDNLQVEFTANPNASMYLTFMASNDGDVDYDTVVEYLADKGSTKTFIIPSYGNDTVVMIISVIDADNNAVATADLFDSQFSYSYSADKVDIADNEEIIDLVKDSLAEIELKDYYIFEPNHRWSYSSSTNSSSSDSVINEPLVLTTNQCTSKSGCITYAADDGREDVSYHYFGDSVYAFEVNGAKVDQFKIISEDVISGVLEPASYSVFGLQDIEDVLQISYSCSPSLSDHFSFNSGVYRALLNDCSIELVGSTGWVKSLDRKYYYVKDVGLVRINDEWSSNDVALFNSTYLLTDSDLVEISVNIFSDLPISHKNRAAILYLNTLGIVGGHPGGTFGPDTSINRAELMKILVEGNGLTPSVDEYNGCFKDVGSEWFAPYVCYAKEMAWVDGYTGGVFKPTQTVKKVEAIKMLLNSQDVVIPTDLSDDPFDDVDVGAWFGPFISKAKELGVLEETGNVFSGDDGMTRGGVCENLYRLLTY